MNNSLKSWKKSKCKSQRVGASKERSLPPSLATRNKCSTTTLTTSQRLSCVWTSNRRWRNKRMAKMASHRWRTMKSWPVWIKKRILMKERRKCKSIRSNSSTNCKKIEETRWSNLTSRKTSMIKSRDRSTREGIKIRMRNLSPRRRRNQRSSMTIS